MKLNKKLEIGLKAIAILKSKSDFVRASDLAPKIGTTPNFLEQILRNLRTAKILTVKRGPGGGYMLNREIDLNAFIVAKAVGTLKDNLKGEEGSVLELRKNLLEAFKSTKV